MLNCIWKLKSSPKPTPANSSARASLTKFCSIVGMLFGFIVDNSWNTLWAQSANSFFSSFGFPSSTSVLGLAIWNRFFLKKSERTSNDSSSERGIDYLLIKYLLRRIYLIEPFWKVTHSSDQIAKQHQFNPFEISKVKRVDSFEKTVTKINVFQL